MDNELKNKELNDVQPEDNQEETTVETPKKNHKFVKGLFTGLGLAVAGLAALAGFAKMNHSSEEEPESEMVEEAETVEPSEE